MPPDTNGLDQLAAYAAAHKLTVESEGQLIHGNDRLDLGRWRWRRIRHIHRPESI